MCMSVHVYVLVTVYSGQKRASDTMDLAFQARNGTLVLREW